MTKPKLTYFDAPVSRGEECRLALHLAGVDFEDIRIRSADDVEAALHEGMMEHVEALRAAVSPTPRMAEAEKRSAREALVAGFLPA